MLRRTQNLQDIIRAHSTETIEGNAKQLVIKAFNSSVTIVQLVEYIEGKRNELIEQREAELEGLSEVLHDIPIVNCGVRNDKVDDIVKAFVRNKSLKTIEELSAELDESLLPRIRQYCMWSYYNQTSNDIIELFLLKHQAVIPTLRKIHDIDFFLRIDNMIVPFDLKFTHISDSYFDLASQGIIVNTDVDIHDNFYLNQTSDTSELKQVKTYYSSFKREHRNLNLPNMSGFDKNELCDLLINTGDRAAEDFVVNLKHNHATYVPSTHEELFPLEWWNYKYQGERLFCNNNRLFVFLAYKEKFVDGRELKGKTTEIGNAINSLLNNLTEADIHTIKYYYDKEESLVGNYTAYSLSTIYSE